MDKDSSSVCEYLVSTSLRTRDTNWMGSQFESESFCASTAESAPGVSFVCCFLPASQNRPVSLFYERIVERVLTK